MGEQNVGTVVLLSDDGWVVKSGNKHSVFSTFLLMVQLLRTGDDSHTLLLAYVMQIARRSLCSLILQEVSEGFFFSLSFSYSR